MNELNDDEERERLESMAEALAEYPAHKGARALAKEQEECPHYELDHNICIDCGADCLDDLIMRAEDAADAAQDREWGI